MEAQPADLPHSVAFIMDGNRRFARARGESAAAGHAAGFATFKTCLRWGKARGIAHLTFYAFSSENWRRSEEEVSALFRIMAHALDSLEEMPPEERARVRIIGDRTALPRDLQDRIERVESETASLTDGTVWVAISYGGRDEIVRAANAAIAQGVSVDADSFAAHLDTAELPDPDIIVRTGGEQRLSNFLTWRSVYSELYFTDTYWPSMTESDFDAILSWYARRHRRFGA